MIVLHELSGTFVFRVADYVQKQTNRVATAYRVLCLAEVCLETSQILLLNVLHPFVVEGFYVLPDLSLTVEGLIVKMTAPMTKIT